MPRSKIHYFPNGAAFRRWLEKNHTRATQVQVGYYKKKTKKPSMTWSESVDEALCFGWIDGVRHSIDDERYTNRFSPRRPSSVWSKINIEKVAKLKKAGRMTEAGLRAFSHKKANKAGLYSYENRPEKLPPQYRKLFAKKPRALAHFESKAPWYQRACTWWVVSAKTEETRERRLAQLVAHHARGETLPALTPRKR
jgi:uncharacterized protein YdeI (YjbR/CyaY-like superfamily)